MENHKVTYEVKLSRPVLVLLWAVVLIFAANTVPGKLVPEAHAGLPQEIRLIFSEKAPLGGQTFDIDD